ncbi:MAG: hypothetical protein AB8B67_03300 [Rickettsiaceae bacterium]
MKKLLITTALAGSLFAGVLTESAMAEDFVLRLGGNLMFPQKLKQSYPDGASGRFKKDVTYSGQAGFYTRLEEELMLGVDFTYFAPTTFKYKPDNKSIKVKCWAIMASGDYEMYDFSNFKAIVAGRAGVSRIKNEYKETKIKFSTKNAYSFAGDIGIGVRLPLEGFSVDLVGGWGYYGKTKTKNFTETKTIDGQEVTSTINVGNKKFQSPFIRLNFNIYM